MYLAKLFKLTIFLLFSICFIGQEQTVYAKNPPKLKRGIFKVLEDGKTLEMNGVIGRSSLKHFNKLLTAYPYIKRIHIKNCNGSKDDETNLKLAKQVYDMQLHIHLLNNGLIASGGVDFFLAGKTRSIGLNTKIGVHAWRDLKHEALDFPRNHPNHQPYITYYQSIGFSIQEALDFYFFTIESAPADQIHWMNQDEIDKYHILKK